ncbi:MAG: AAA family ATPase [Lachnospiraceae bacterium]|nr:AAA family ATPase [Lachnospiraceae bacterium]
METTLNKNISKEELCEIFKTDTCYVNSMEVPVFCDMSKVPSLDPNYVFNTEILNQVLLFLANPYNDCLFLSGASGCGKTSIILQIASRLGYAVEQITCSAKTEIQDLIGHQIIKKGTLSYEYGALAKAMLEGEILLINEIDMLGAGELSGLNDVLEGKPLTIVANNGEVIKPHPNFRVIATGNTKGNGDNTGLYLGARVLNKAFLDRWRFVECTYPSAENEKEILRKSCPKISEEDLEHFAQLAVEIRRITNNGSDEMSCDLSCPFSTRTLLRIARFYENVEPYTIYDAVKYGFSSRLSEVESEFISRLVSDVFGNNHIKVLEEEPKHTVIKRGRKKVSKIA